MGKLTYSAFFSENLTRGQTAHKRNLGGGGQHENVLLHMRGHIFLFNM